MSNSNFALLSLSIASIIAASSCGKLDDMHDATMALKTKTDEVGATSQDLKTLTTDVDKKSADLDQKTTQVLQTSQDLKTLTTDLLDENRQGNAVTIRGQRLDAMDKTKDQQAKIGEAGLYYSAFEFQLWTDFANDDEAKLQQLYVDSVTEYFRVISQYIHPDYNPSPTSNDNRMKNLYALAVTMHQVNPNETWIVPNQTALNMLDLVKNSLAAKELGESGKTLPAYQVEVLNHPHEEEAVYMLQLRANFLPAMTLANISKLQKGGLTAKWAEAKMYLKAWDADISNANLESLEEFRAWMAEANATATFLKGIGQSAKLDTTVQKIFRNMRPLNPNSNDKQANPNLRKAAVQKIQDQINLYKVSK